MTKEELAATLNGRQYLSEMTLAEQALANKSGLVVIFGASDDLMEIRGAVNDEISAYGGTSAPFTSAGLLENECDSERCPHYARFLEAATAVTAIWDIEGYSWIYTTDIPHATFDIMEDDEKYCRGIIFSLSDVAP